MITDNQTNYVYFSEGIQSYTESWNRIKHILKRHNIDYGLLINTKDIWARDYMPVQSDINKFIQFRYEPSYLSELPNLRSYPQYVCNSNYINPVYSYINIDGGNIVKGKNRVMISDRIFSENPEYSDKKKLVTDIEKLLNTEIIIIPQINNDFTGHADGMVRFIDDNTIIGTDRKNENGYWVKGINKVLKEYNLHYVDMPFFEYKDKDYPDTAIGCYVNYLEIGNVIIFPVFQVEGNKDRESLNIIKTSFSDKIIEEININEIVNYGGLINCISWNIQMNKMSSVFIRQFAGGLRGDPFLWKEMQEYFMQIEDAESIDDFNKLIHSTFTKLTGLDIIRGKQYFIRRFNLGGMSSGFISCDFWLDHAIPELLNRYRNIKYFKNSIL